MKHIPHIFLFLLLFSGCKIQGAVSPVSQSDSAYVSKADSVYVRDSIFVDRFISVKEKGDTIYIVKEKTQYRDRIKELSVHDTLYVDRDVILEKTVPAELSSWDKFQKKAFWIMGIILLAGVAIKIIRR